MAGKEEVCVVPVETTGRGSLPPLEAKNSGAPPTKTEKALAQSEADHMTDQHEAFLAGEEHAIQQLQQPSGAGSPSPSALQMGKKDDAAPPPPTGKALSQAEEGVFGTRKPRHTAKAQENMEFGAGIAAFGVSMLVAWFFLSPEDRGAHNLCYITPMLLSFSCFAVGVSLMLLSMNILELPEKNVDDVLEVASKYLSFLCSILPVVTLLSPLVLSGYKFYRYIGLTLLVMVTAPIVFLRWYIGRKADEGDEHTAEIEQEALLEAAFKFISAISNSASGGLVALVVNYNVTGGSGRTKGATLLAIFFIFTTAIWGLLSMEIRTKVLEIKSKKLRGFIIRAMCLAIIFMLFSLACAVFAESFAIVEFYVFAVFTPWVFASAVYLFHKHCINPARIPRDNYANVSLEIHLNCKADRGIKITMWSFMAIIGIFGGFLHGHDKIESLKACIIFLASAFMSGLSLTILLTSIRPDATSTSLGVAITVLDWTGAATFVAAIFAVIVAMVLETL